MAKLCPATTVAFVPDALPGKELGLAPAPAAFTVNAEEIAAPPVVLTTTLTVPSARN